MTTTAEDTINPYLISWNLTKRCNLKCSHCYLDAEELSDGTGDISTNEALKIVDELAVASPGAMLILTGGEPLLRDDIFEIAAYAKERAMTVVLGTNGTLIDDELIKKIKDSDISGVGISLDSVSADYHDKLRAIDGAWARTIASAKLLHDAQLDFQIHLTVTKDNRLELAEMARLAEELNAKSLNIFFLVCTGRGEEMTDLSPEEYEEALMTIDRLAVDYEGRLMVRARCAPHIKRITASESAYANITSGCIAGRGYIRISPEGQVTPCPYVPPTEDTPSILNTRLDKIFEVDIFKSFAKPNYGGKCGECEFMETCGGCRARALATSGDVMGEDPWCAHQPSKDSPENFAEVVWSSPAKERLKKIPIFLRTMVKAGVEAYAKKKNIKEITPEIMATLRERFKGGRPN